MVKYKEYATNLDPSYWGFRTFEDMFKVSAISIFQGKEPVSGIVDFDR